MNVSACLVTRGNVDMQPILDSLTASGIEDIVIWDNSKRDDLAVYGRYAAIVEAKHDLIWTQDDDCVVSDPQVIVEKWLEVKNSYVPGYHTTSIQWADRHVVCNMPSEFRHEFYEDHALVGFGACFHRDAFDRAMRRFAEGGGAAILAGSRGPEELAFWRRTCDIVFTMLTPRVLVDVPYENLPWANSPDRMWKQMDHIAERTRMRDLVRKVRDGG